METNNNLNNSEQNSASVSVTDGSKNNVKKFFITLLILIVIGLGFIAYMLFDNNNQKPVSVNKNKSVATTTPQLTPQQRQAIDTAQDVAALLSSSTTTLPKIISSKDISQAELPALIKPFIKPGAEDVQAQQVVFTNNSKGYKVVYSLKSGISDTYELFGFRGGSSAWNLVTQGYSNHAVLVMLQNKFYLLQIVGNYLSDNSTLVIIAAMGK